MATPASHRELGVFQRPYGWHVLSADSIEYRVAYVPGLLDTDASLIAQIDPALADRAASRNWLVIVDSRVDEIYGTQLRAWLGQQECSSLEIIPVGVRESDKNLTTVSQLIGVLAHAKLRRRDQLVVVGGGVLIDLVGVVAAMWRKGTPLWVIPTTLIGATDAGLAVKRAVNVYQLDMKVKNAIGDYHEPELVLVAPEWWRTVPPHDITSAAAEMLKVGCVVDPELAYLLEDRGADLVSAAFQPSDPDFGKPAELAIRAAIDGTLRELQRDQRETCLQRKLDFGHDFGGALEMAALDQLPHGHGVGINISWAAALGTQLRDADGPLLDADTCHRIFRALEGLGVPTTHDLLTPSLIADALAGVALHRGGEQNVPVLRDFGEVTWASGITSEQAAAALALQNHLARA